MLVSVQSKKVTNSTERIWQLVSKVLVLRLTLQHTEGQYFTLFAIVTVECLIRMKSSDMIVTTLVLLVMLAWLELLLTR
jgi:hypothetical protein